MTTDSFRQYAVALMGCPQVPDVPWTQANVRRLKALGFNTVQLNIAWGCRPGDEPLTLEDVVEIPAAALKLLPRGLKPWRGDRSPEAMARRQRDLRERIAAARAEGLRTLFHFGAPNTVCYSQSDAERTHEGMPFCVLDPATTRYYELMLNAFFRAYPGVDDILVYTFDQDAWVCNEFGACPRCQGVPLPERLTPFVNALGANWRALNPQGRLWWEPWELSGGQVYKCVEALDAATVGLMLHANIAEVMSTLPVDRWLKNTVALARGRGIPVVVEYFLGIPTEEIEPFQYLPYPLVTLRGLKAIAAVEGIAGIKEYYGTVPDREDANLRMTGLFLHDPGIGEDAALRQLAEPYGAARDGIIEFWKLTSQAMELFPWEISWQARCLGRADVNHAMSGAFIRGTCCHSPSWDSSRNAIFMKTENSPVLPAMLEDVQLRCEISARYFARAGEAGKTALDSVPEELRATLRHALDEIDGVRRRALAYVYHLRETNLATVMRGIRARGEALPPRLTAEMKALLTADRVNRGAADPEKAREVDAALVMLAADTDRFLAEYFRADALDTCSRGPKSVTSK